MRTQFFQRAGTFALILVLLLAAMPVQPVHATGTQITHNTTQTVTPPLPPSCPAVSATTFTNTTPLAIPTGPAVVSSTITVSGANPYLWDLDLRTFLTHTFAADLDITLQSPAGTVVTLTTDNGAGNDDVFNGTLWDDDANDLATDHVYANLALASPLVPEEALGAFIGEDPNGNWILTISDDLAGDGGSLGSWSLILTASPTSLITTATTFTNTTALAIPTGPAVVSSTITVSGLAADTTDINLTTSITHTFAADLDITLQSPAGTVVTLTTDNGAGNDDVFNGTLWDDDANDLATDHVYANLALASPLVPEEALAAFIGEDPNGNWVLTISDDLAGDGGSLGSWSLSVTTGSCAPPLTVAGSNPSAGAVLTSPKTLTVTFSENAVSDGSATAANNPVNYLLVERGGNSAFDTDTCDTGLAGDDVKQIISSVTYKSSGFISTLNLANPLAAGSYRLFICGTTSIWSAAGRELNDGASDTTVDFTVTAASSLPETGFATGRVTFIPVQPTTKAYTGTDLTLEIPALNIKTAIVGVPQDQNGWDVTWLGQEAGWLDGSAFPTWDGNSVLTGHVWDANNQPGLFANLKTLKYGDKILIHTLGMTYTYEVRESQRVSSSSIQTVMKHEKLAWLTLLTCEDYRGLWNSYSGRRMVRAVLVSVK